MPWSRQVASRLDRVAPEVYVVHHAGSPWSLAIGLVAFGLVAVTGLAGASTLLDYVTFDGIDYIRWAEEPGARSGATIAPSSPSSNARLEDLRGCRTE